MSSGNKHLEIVDPTRDPLWDRIVGDHPGANVFHSAAWAEVLRKTYGYSPVYLTSMTDDRLRFLLPLMDVRSAITGRRGVSLPFTDHCDPLAQHHQPIPDLELALDEIGRQKKWKYIEVRGDAVFPESAPPWQSFWRHTLDVDRDPEAIFRDFRKGTKSTIKKAEREGITIRWESSEESLKKFCRLNALTRRGHGVPPQPLTFFRHLLTDLIARGLGDIFLAEYDGRCIAGCIFLKFGSRVVYKYGASDRKYNPLGATNLILWQAIQKYAGERWKSLCFGRTSPDNTGLIRFKDGWGTESGQIHYYRRDLESRAYLKGPAGARQKAGALFTKLPLPIAQAVGSMAYRHFG